MKINLNHTVASNLHECEFFKKLKLPQMILLESEEWHEIVPGVEVSIFNINRPKQVIAFDEVERKPNFVALLCRVSCPV